MNEVLSAALAYARRGWRVFPLHGIVNGACTCGRAECSSPGKHPLVRRGLYAATCDFRVIKAWWRKWGSANVGIATGSESGIVVVDVDLPRAADSLEQLVHKLPSTLTGLTGGGGLHLIYRRGSGDLRCTSARLPGIEADLPGIDLRANGGYIVAPPSVHISGSRYEWLDANRDPAPAPEWLKQSERVYVEPDHLVPGTFEGDGTAYGLAVLRDEVDTVRAAQLGTRNHQLNRSAFALAQLVAGGELDEAVARSSLLEAALAVGLDDHEGRQTIASAFRAGLRHPRAVRNRVRARDL